jgi:hypothetical protein
MMQSGLIWVWMLAQTQALEMAVQEHWHTVLATPAVLAAL